MAKYIVRAESFVIRDVLVEADNIDEAEEKFRRGEFDEEYQTPQREEVLSIASVNESHGFAV